MAHAGAGVVSRLGVGALCLGSLGVARLHQLEEGKRRVGVLSSGGLCSPLLHQQAALPLEQHQGRAWRGFQGCSAAGLTQVFSASRMGP